MANKTSDKKKTTLINTIVENRPKGSTGSISLHIDRIANGKTTAR